MYRNIVVPLDGSPFAECALPPALSIARRAGAALQVVRAHVPPTSFQVSAEVPPQQTLETSIRESERAYLEGVVERITATAPSVTVSSTMMDGPAADAIHNRAIAVPADLVVMATHGRGSFSRFWLGSVADALIRRLPTPILLVRPQQTTPDLTRDELLKHILIPLDGSEIAEQVLEPAATLGMLMQADYRLLRVVDPLGSAGTDASGYSISGLVPEGGERLKKEAEDYLERVAVRLRRQSLSVLTRVVVSCQAAEAILAEAEKSPTDLIALETHGRGGLARVLLGSVADKVVRGSSTPVLVHRPR